MRNVKIIGINGNPKYPGVIYAELIDVDRPVGSQIIMIGELTFIFSFLKDNKEKLNCVNVYQDKRGYFHIN